MRVIVTGAAGQLGRAIVSGAPESVELIPLTRDDADLSDPTTLDEVIPHARPALIINAAAYTAVDRAEDEEELATAVNGTSVARLAALAVEHDARLIHVSTDFVFHGDASTPYSADAKTDPLSAYGRSKLVGEEAVLAHPSGVVVRTSRVYSRHGSNFVLTMLRLMSSEPRLTVVDDQVGSPTWTSGLASVLWRIAAETDMAGVWQWTDGGACSWHEWAVEIQQRASQLGVLDREVPIEPVATEGFPTPAPRPRYSVLDCSATERALGIRQQPWQEALGTMLTEMATDPDTSFP